MNGWYGVADTNLADSVDGISRFGAQNGDQSTGGVIDFGLNDVNGVSLEQSRVGTSLNEHHGLNCNRIEAHQHVWAQPELHQSQFLGELWRNN